MAWVARLGMWPLKLVKYVKASRHSRSVLGSELDASVMRRAKVPMTAAIGVT